jgi:hypothetical protein
MLRARAHDIQGRYESSINIQLHENNTFELPLLKQQLLLQLLQYLFSRLFPAPYKDSKLIMQNPISQNMQEAIDHGQT